jgi:hypothetical protein
MKRLNSVGIVAFTVTHDADEPTVEEMRAALLRRILDLDANRDEWHEAVEVTDTVENYEGEHE